MIPKNEYGNVDVRGGAPAGYIHIAGKRLQPTCRRLNIEYAEAFVGFGGTKRYPKALTDGVVIAEGDTERLKEAIAIKKAKDTPEIREKRAKRRAEKYEAERNHFAARIRERFPKMSRGKARVIAARACEVGSGRIGRSKVAEEEGDDTIMAAVVAHVRHNNTEYDWLIRYSKKDPDKIREKINKQIGEIIRQWTGQ